MKYGKILEEHIILEYKSFYIDYKYLKQNINESKSDFLELIEREINKVEDFFSTNQKSISNINNFCLFNLFSILKILKKYKKKTNLDICQDVYDIYFKKSFYLHLVTCHNFTQVNIPVEIDKCSSCYDRNKYILDVETKDKTSSTNSAPICNACSKSQSSNQIVISLEEVTKNTFNPFYLPLIKYPKRCLFIGIDGLRPDCLLFSKTPNIDKILKNGVYNFDTKIQTETFSAPSWGAILSGYQQNNTCIYSNEYVEKEDYKWKTTNIFDILHKKGVSTYSFTSSWSGMKHLVQNSEYHAHFSEKSRIIDNDKATIDETFALLNKMKNYSFALLYLNSVDYSGHTHGFSIQSKEYIDTIETLDRYLENIIQLCMKQHISVVVTTDHGGSRKSDLDEANIQPFFTREPLQPQQLYQGVHGLNCLQHKRVFQIYYGNIVNFESKEDINIENNLNIYKKIVNYFD